LCDAESRKQDADRFLGRVSIQARKLETVAHDLRRIPALPRLVEELRAKGPQLVQTARLAQEFDQHACSERRVWFGFQGLAQLLFRFLQASRSDHQADALHAQKLPILTPLDCALDLGNAGLDGGKLPRFAVEREQRLPDAPLARSNLEQEFVERCGLLVLAEPLGQEGSQAQAQSQFALAAVQIG
jgi:hypothetical protein